MKQFNLDPRFAKSRDSENRAALSVRAEQQLATSQSVIYIYSHAQALNLLDQFIRGRFKQFATYQDAVVPRNPVLVHSALSMAINTGILLPQEILARVYTYNRQSEAFVRQLLGWREFAICYYAFKANDLS